ncbi:GIY-YIG nuclease family protein [Croceiramulus getboli]|nr:GIY-YIG nuclease family protein [Flavobacteriaceae bacterium YJPT1-3]
MPSRIALVLPTADKGENELVDLPTVRQARCDLTRSIEKVMVLIWVYAISSVNQNYIYVGMTQDLFARIKRHNAGRERTTKPYLPYELIYSDSFETRALARKKEKFLKTGVGKEKLRLLRSNKNK